MQRWDSTSPFGVRAGASGQSRFFRAAGGQWDELLAALPRSDDARREWRLPAAGPRSVPRLEPDVTRAVPSDTTPFGGVRNRLTACQRPQRMPGVDEHARSERATTLAARLDEAAAALISVVANIEPDRWRRIPAPGVWSIGKDAEHVIEAAGYHEWIVRLTIGQRVPSRRPVLERRQLTTDLSPQQAVALLRRRSDEGDRAPPRANGRAAEPAHSTAARPIPGARRDDRARPDRPLRRASRRHRSKAPNAFGCAGDHAVGNQVVPPRHISLGT